MAGGRPRKPTALKLIQNTARKDRTNVAEPKPKQTARVPAPPGYLGTKAKSEWKRVAKELHEMGVLTRVDTKILANYCMAYDDMLTAQGLLNAWNLTNPNSKNLFTSMSGHIKTHPLVDQVRQHRQDMNKFAAEFGITPASRSRVTAKGQKKKGEFDDF